MPWERERPWTADDRREALLYAVAAALVFGAILLLYAVAAALMFGAILLALTF